MHLPSSSPAHGIDVEALDGFNEQVRARVCPVHQVALKVDVDESWWACPHEDVFMTLDDADMGERAHQVGVDLSNWSGAGRAALIGIRSPIEAMACAGREIVIAQSAMFANVGLAIWFSAHHHPLPALIFLAAGFMTQQATSTIRRARTQMRAFDSRYPTARMVILDPASAPAGSLVIRPGSRFFTTAQKCDGEIGSKVWMINSMGDLVNPSH